MLIGTTLISLIGECCFRARGKGCLRTEPALMIIGMGIDLAEVERYQFSDAERERFARKVYTDEEMHYAMRKRHWAERLAGFYAAKEATRKAFGHAIAWRDVGVTHERSGRPTIALYGKAAELIERRGVRAIHLTITHTATMAAAVVILEG